MDDLFLPVALIVMVAFFLVLSWGVYQGVKRTAPLPYDKPLTRPVIAMSAPPVIIDDGTPNLAVKGKRIAWPDDVNEHII